MGNLFKREPIVLVVNLVGKLAAVGRKLDMTTITCLSSKEIDYEVSTR